jgi:thiol-disulfide isomerase/thioredoxin
MKWQGTNPLKTDRKTNRNKSWKLALAFGLLTVSSVVSTLSQSPVSAKLIPAPKQAPIQAKSAVVASNPEKNPDTLTVQDKDGKLSTLTIDKNTLVIASATWCGYCKILVQQLQESPSAFKGKKLVFVMGDEYRQLRYGLAQENLPNLLEGKLTPEEWMQWLENEVAQEKQKTGHPYVVYPEKLKAYEALGAAVYFLPKDCKACSPLITNGFPSVYSLKTHTFQDSPWDRLPLKPPSN